MKFYPVNMRVLTKLRINHCGIKLLQMIIDLMN
jgi:hypothetical protein